MKILSELFLKMPRGNILTDFMKGQVDALFDSGKIYVPNCQSND